MNMLVRTASRVIFGTFVAGILLMPFSSLAINNTLPGAGINSSDQFLEIARYGHGNTLHSPITYLKLAYTGNPTYVGIFDGAYCVPSNYDTNDIGGGTTGYTSPSCTNNYNDDQRVDYTFYGYNNATHTKSSASINVQNKQLTQNATSWVNVSSLPKITNDTNDLHYIIMKVAFYHTSSGIGGVNAFKVSLNSEADPATSLGYATYDSADTASSTLDLPFSVQNRASAGPDTMKFQFAPGCDVAADQPGYLRWFDADSGGKNQPDNIKWKLFDIDVSTTVPEYSLAGFNSSGGTDYVRNSAGTIVKDLAGKYVPMGGSAADERFNMLFKAYHRYLWQWENVDRANGVQFYLPFDSLGYKFGCAPVSVYKDVLKGSTITAGSSSTVGNATVNIGYGTHTATDDSSTVQGHTFQVPSGADRVSVTNPYKNPTTNLIYTPIGFRSCDLTAKPLCNFDKANSNTALLNKVGGSYQFPNFLRGHKYQIHWYYGLGAAVCSSITVSPTTVVPGGTIKVDMSFRNTGVTTWSTAAGYNAKKGPNPPIPAKIGPATVAFPAFPASPSSYVGTGYYTLPTTAQIAAATVIFPQFSFSAPATPGTYAVEYYIAEKGTIIDLPCTKTVTVAISAPVHKIFGLNIITILQKYVRDNFTFPFQVSAYFWPDAGQKSDPTDGNKRMWLSGIWDDKVGVPEGNKNTEINNMTTINTAAETNCPNAGGCLQRVPLAYLPQNDGKGIAATLNADGSTSADGSTTPAGNNWLSIKNRIFGSYDARLGGIASNDNSFIGDYTGNHIKQVEISNIHVGLANIGHSLHGDDSAANFGTAYQGVSPNSIIQPSDQIAANPTSNLPTGSQGPSGPAGSPLGSGVWDNVRNPNLAYSDYGVPALLNTVEFPGSSFNFTADPTTISSGGIAGTGAQQNLSSADGQATSLLQDGQGGGYKNPSEPFTLTGSVTSADVSLKWDEFANWSQVDDKGHYYPTQSKVATGFAYGDPTATDVSVVASHNPGSSQLYTVTDPYTTSLVCPNGYPYYYATTNLCYTNSAYTGTGVSQVTQYNCPAGDTQSGSGSSTICTHTAYTTCTNTPYNTGVKLNFQDYTYYTPNAEDKYGWITKGYATFAGTARGTFNGATQQSYFGGYESSTPPGLAGTGITDFWQDPAVTTGMNFAGSSPPLTVIGSQQWVYEAFDPLYHSRLIYNIANTVTKVPYSWSYTTTTYCDYPNKVTPDPTATVNTGTYYPSRTLLYENTATATGTIVGRYNFTEDGNVNGYVDTGWGWASNKSRTQYAQTFNGHERKLGSRSLADPAASPSIDCTDATANPDTYFLGENTSSPTGAKCLLPGRDSGTIYNPTIGVSLAADVFGTKRIDGYFSSSNAPSAFLFSNGSIAGFNSLQNFQNYYNNDSPRANTLYDKAGGLTAITKVFGNFFTSASTPSTSLPGNSITTPSFDLSQNSSRLYKATGDVTVGTPGTTTLFTGGNGTIYVNGNLHIQGNVGYAAGDPSDRHLLPSVGFVVTGYVIIDPNVTSIVGTYFAGRSFNTRSVLKDYSGITDVDGTYIDNRASSDQGFSLNGLMIALDFSLQRQPSGKDLAGKGLPENKIPENFIYDGRVVVNPPTGFTDIQKYPASWNESVPYN